MGFSWHSGSERKPVSIPLGLLSPDDCIHLTTCHAKLVQTGGKPKWMSVSFREVFLFWKKNEKKRNHRNHLLTSCYLSFPLIRTEFYPKAVRSVWIRNSKRSGILCGNGAPSQRLLHQCRVRCWYGKRSSDVPWACHETLGQGGQIGPQFLPVKPVQLSPHPDRHRAREQVRQWER